MSFLGGLQTNIFNSKFRAKRYFFPSCQHFSKPRTCVVGHRITVNAQAVGTLPVIRNKKGMTCRAGLHWAMTKYRHFIEAAVCMGHRNINWPLALVLLSSFPLNTLGCGLLHRQTTLWFDLQCSYFKFKWNFSE